MLYLLTIVNYLQTPNDDDDDQNNSDSKHLFCYYVLNINLFNPYENPRR